MTTTEYFYRVKDSPDFLRGGKKLRLIPARFKTPFTERDEYFSAEQNEWLPLGGGSRTSAESLSGMQLFSQDGAALEGIPAEFVEAPKRPLAPDMTSDIYLDDFPRSPLIEEMNAEQMERTLAYRAQSRRFRFDRKNCYDSDGIKKDIAFVSFETDTEALTLEMTIGQFAREKNEALQAPKLVERSIAFDMKNGAVFFEGWEGYPGFNEKITEKTYTHYNYERGKDIKEKVMPSMRYNATNTFLSLLSDALPKKLLGMAAQKLLELARAFTGAELQISDQEFSSGKRQLNFMRRLTLLPFAPQLCEVLFSRKLEKRNFHFDYERNDSKVFKRFCKKAKIRNTKTLRRRYLCRANTLLVAMTLREAGFKDMNLVNRVIESDDYMDFIYWLDGKSLAFFCQYSIKKRGQKATLNTLLKSIPNEDDDPELDFDISDAIDMFCKYFKHIPETLKKDILQDGFTPFNHDALSNIAYRFEHKNVTFKHTAEEKALEGTIDGYEFRLPENSDRLCDIGTCLHNCVASYSDKVKKKQRSIVYVLKDGKYHLCIELDGKEIKQERADHNKPPSKEDRAVLDKWHKRHGLKR